MEGNTISEHVDYEYVTSSGGIDEYKLKANNMGVLLMEDFSAPGFSKFFFFNGLLVVAVMVTYMVGSRNEAIGYTGSTHLLVIQSSTTLLN
jgi:zinc protease